MSDNLMRYGLAFVCLSLMLFFGVIGTHTAQSIFNGYEAHYCGTGLGCTWTWIDFSMSGLVVFVSCGVVVFMAAFVYSILRNKGWKS